MGTRFLYAAVAAFVIPFVAGPAIGLALEVPLATVFEDLWGLVLAGLMAAAPFLLMAAARNRSPGAWLAAWAGLALTVLPWIILVADLMMAEPGRGANIGLGLLVLVWPLIVFLVMLGVSFMRPRRA